MQAVSTGHLVLSTLSIPPITPTTMVRLVDPRRSSRVDRRQCAIRGARAASLCASCAHTANDRESSGVTFGTAIRSSQPREPRSFARQVAIGACTPVTADERGSSRSWISTTNFAAGPGQGQKGSPVTNIMGDLMYAGENARSLRFAGMQKVQAGVTTVDEVRG